VHQSAASCCTLLKSETGVADEGIRVTATITAQQDRLLRALAAKHKVSVAWLVREAIDRLLREGESIQLPLDLGSRR